MTVFTGLVCILLLTSTCFARDIPRETLDELESLLKQFKKSGTPRETVRSVSTPQVNLPPHETVNTLIDITDTPLSDPRKNECAHKCRISFEECLAYAGSQKEKMKCTELFYKCFPTCYFGNSIHVGNPNQFLCRGTCLRNYDQCIFGGKNMPDRLSCYTYRRVCFDQCPNSAKRTIVKRSCMECDGDYTMCMEAIEEPFQTMGCIVVREQCKDKYCEQNYGSY